MQQRQEDINSNAVLTNPKKQTRKILRGGSTNKETPVANFKYNVDVFNDLFFSNLTL